jgi:hypothetical protein
MEAAMSISTLESPASVRALDAMHSAADTAEASEQHAREEIAQAFGLIRTLPSMLVALPSVQERRGGVRVGSVTLQEAIRDLTTDGYCFEQLLAVLQASDCPLVQKLRDTLCAEYQRMNAGDIAEARS